MFHKPSDYSSLEDSSVRVHARHLRLKLHEYFDEEGRNEPIVLTIPRGCYTPIFKPSIARRFDFRRSGYPCGSFTLLLQRWSEPTITGPACCGRGLLLNCLCRVRRFQAPWPLAQHPLPVFRRRMGDLHSLTPTLEARIQRIVIDPGHGGHDTGTTGPPV